MTQPLIVERGDGVLRLRFDRPKVLNALDESTATAFLAAMHAAASDTSLRAVLLAASGRAFMAGGDLGALRGADAAAGADAIIGPLHAALEIMAALDAPVIASVQGAVAGAGLGLALAADIVVAANDAKFSVAYCAIGANPDGSTSWSLPRALGVKRALGLALLGDVVGAEEALRIGLVQRVVPLATLAEETEAILARLASGPTAAFGRTKRLLRSALDHDLVTHMRAERDAFLAGAATADFAEGVEAFLARRPPRFTGR